MLKLHHRLCVLLATGAALLPGPYRQAAAQTLDQIRAETRTPSTYRDDDEYHHHHHHDHHGHDYDDDGDSQLWDMCGEYMLVVLAAPFWGPKALMNDDYGLPGLFLDHPYQDQAWGNLLIAPYDLTRVRPWSLRLSGEYTDDFDALSFIGGRMLLETTSRFGMDAEMNYRREELGGGLHDDLWTGDANVILRFAQCESVQMRTGVGFNWLSDSVGSDFGFNFTYGGDWFLHDPFVLSAELDLGAVGASDLVHVRTTIGMHYRHVELYTGYDLYSVGGAETDGLIAGVRLWW